MLYVPVKPMINALVSTHRWVCGDDDIQMREDISNLPQVNMSQDTIDVIATTMFPFPTEIDSDRRLRQALAYWVLRLRIGLDFDQNLDFSKYEYVDENGETHKMFSLEQVQKENAHMAHAKEYADTIHGLYILELYTSLIDEIYGIL